MTNTEEVPGCSNPILQHFLWGQYGNLFKFSLWWCALAPLTYALLNSVEAIGVGRIVYNSALCILSPVGAVVVERVAPRKMLLATTWVRFIVWCLLLPLLWLVMDKEWLSASPFTLGYIVFNVMLFIDGVTVGMGNILDIDACGLDMIGGHYKVEITDGLRNYFNTRHEIFFAGCFVILSPAMAVLGYEIREYIKNSPWASECEITSAIMVGIFFVGFLLSSLLSLFHYTLLPVERTAPSEDVPGESKPLIQDQAEEKPTSTWIAVKEAVGSLGETVKVIWAHSAVKWRLFFLALEIALEDAIIIVVAAELTLKAKYFGKNDAVLANVWSAGLIACGKLGGVLASYVMMHFFEPPTNIQGYRKLFVLIFIGGVSTVGFPLSHMLAQISEYEKLGIAALFVTFFVFFFFSTLPKLGFMCLLQNLAAQIDGGGRIFGFIAVIVTAVDALVIMGISLVYRDFPIEKGLWITFIIFASHGLLELLVGPLLVLRALVDPPKEGGEGSAKAGEVSASLPPDVVHSPTTPKDNSKDPLASTGTYATYGVTTERLTPQGERVHAISFSTGPQPKVGSFLSRSPVGGSSLRVPSGIGDRIGPGMNSLRRASGLILK